MVAIATSFFLKQGRLTAGVEGLPSLPTAEIPHPLAGLPAEAVEERAKSIIDAVVAGLTQSPESGGKAKGGKVVVKPEPEFVRAGGNTGTQALRALNRLYRKKQWTDGFPVVPPTREAVDWMLTGTDRNPDEVIGLVPPLWGKATVRNIAVNAVMAGAEPAYLPVIITAVATLTDEKFAASADGGVWGAAGMQATTGSVSPLLIVNGPVAKDLKIESGVGCFGRGHHANATIGRALRLVMTNAGGAQPGVNDMKCHGSAQEFTYCVAEREEHPVYHLENNRWGPLNVERGFPAETSTVTVAAAYPPICVNEISQDGFNILEPLVDSIVSVGLVPYALDWEYVIVLNQAHAQRLADADWTKESIRQYLYANAVLPWGKYQRQYLSRSHPAWMTKTVEDTTSIHLVGSPASFIIIVAGGECQYSNVIRCSAGSVTQPIKLPGDWKEILKASALD
ncbi:MAG: hypothetical protein ABID87_09795 [Chloroflexota bacterium]